MLRARLALSNRTKENDMFKMFLSLGLAALALTATANAQAGVGSAPPEFKASKWYNTAPITLDDLKGKAVLIQVFRTW
jgi:hypothetical protein